MKKLMLILPVLLLLTGCSADCVHEKSDDEIMRDALLLQVSDKPAPEPEPYVEEEPAQQPEEDNQPAKDPVQEPIVEEVAKIPVSYSYPGGNFKRDGVWYDERFRYTWYSSNVTRHYRTDEWTPDSQGVYRYSDGYAVVASNDYPQGTVIEGTLFGTAKVYDCGCDSGTLDVYVNF